VCTQRLAYALAFGARGESRLHAGGREHRVERAGELAVAVAHQKSESADVLVKVHQQVSGPPAHPSGITKFTPDDVETWYRSRDRKIFLGDVLDSHNSESMSLGFAHYAPGESNASVVTYDEALVVTKGALTVTSAEGVETTARVGEVVFLRAGTPVVYSAKDAGAEVVYVIYPALDEGAGGLRARRAPRDIPAEPGAPRTKRPVGLSEASTTHWSEVSPTASGRCSRHSPTMSSSARRSGRSAACGR
jgi:ethanolamine utilization protein EutQ (cupin superfamily)